MSFPRLLEAALVALVVAGCGRPPLAVAGSVVVTEGHALPSVGGGMSAFVTLENRGGQADTVVGFSSPLAGDVMLHRSESMGNGLVKMVHQGELVLEPGRPVRMRSGEMHLMLREVRSPLGPGDSLPLRLELHDGRVLEVVVPVRPFGADP